jgi:hypothetical protein
MSKLESEIQQLILIEASKHDIKLWRNNSGALKDATGRLVRYGLGNTSEQINKELKTSDLIGITPFMFGDIKVGIFTAIECKREGWVFNPNDKREQAQMNYINAVISRGGLAGFASSIDEFLKIVRR